MLHPKKLLRHSLLQDQVFFSTVLASLAFFFTALSDTFFRSFILAIVALFSFFIHKKYPAKNGSFSAFLLWVWFLIFLIQLLQLATSHSIPLSLEELSVWVGGFLAFSTGYTIARTKKSWFQSVIPLSISIFLFLGIALNIFLLFLPSFISKMPDKTIFSPTYGQSHLVTLILLFLPFLWNWTETLSSVRQKWSIRVILCLGVVVAGSRVGILFGALEVLFLSFPSFSTWKKKKQWWISLAVGTFFLLSLIFLQSLRSCNPENTTRQLLCKPVAEEQRPRYWRLALEGFRLFPLNGYGAGTFELLSQRYNLDPGHHTSYAHSSLLQILAEQGSIGFLIFAVFLLASHKYVIIALKEKSSWYFSFALGIVFVTGKSFVDFDLSLTPVFLAWTFFLGILSVQDQPHTAKPILASHTHRLVVQLGVFLLNVQFFLFVLTELFIRTGNSSIAFSFYPFFPFHSPLYAQTLPLHSSQSSRFQTLYGAHPLVLETLLGRSDLEPAEFHLLLDQWLELNTWQNFSLQTHSYFIAHQEYEKAEHAALRQLKLWHFAKNEKNYFIPQADWETMSSSLVAIAGWHYQEGRGTTAALWLRYAYSFDNWSLDRNDVFFLFTPVSEETQNAVAEVVYAIPPEKFGNNRENVAQFLLQRAHRQANQHSGAWFLEQARFILALAPWHATHHTFFFPLPDQLPPSEKILLQTELQKLQQSEHFSPGNVNAE